MRSFYNSIFKYSLVFSILLIGITFQSAHAQENWEPYGEEITASDALDANDAVSHFTKDGKKLTVRGTITAVCSLKGCWASFVTDDKETIKVKFKNHNFLIPTESAGRRMVAEGVAFKDQADSETDADATYKYRLVADGVLLEK